MITRTEPSERRRSLLYANALRIEVHLSRPPVGLQFERVFVLQSFALSAKKSSSLVERTRQERGGRKRVKRVESTRPVPGNLSIGRYSFADIRLDRQFRRNRRQTRPEYLPRNISCFCDRHLSDKIKCHSRCRLTRAEMHLPSSRTLSRKGSSC